MEMNSFLPSAEPHQILCNTQLVSGFSELFNSSAFSEILNILEFLDMERHFSMCYTQTLIFWRQMDEDKLVIHEV